MVSVDDAYSGEVMATTIGLTVDENTAIGFKIVAECVHKRP